MNNKGKGKNLVDTQSFNKSIELDEFGNIIRTQKPQIPAKPSNGTVGKIIINESTGPAGSTVGANRESKQLEQATETKKQERPRLKKQEEISPASQAETMYQQYSQMYLHNNQVPPPKSYQQIYNQQQHNQQFQQQQQQQLQQPIQQQQMQQQQMQQGYTTGFQHQPHHLQQQYQLQQQRIQEQAYHQMMELNAQFGYAPQPQNIPHQQKQQHQQQQQHNQIQAQPRQQLYNHTTPNYSLPPSIYNQPNSTYGKPPQSR